MNNVTGGILLLVLGAGFIVLGTSEKAKRIFNIATESELNKYQSPKIVDEPEEPIENVSGGETRNNFGFVGDAGSSYVG